MSKLTSEPAYTPGDGAKVGAPHRDEMPTPKAEQDSAKSDAASSHFQDTTSDDAPIDPREMAMIYSGLKTVRLTIFHGFVFVVSYLTDVWYARIALGQHIMAYLIFCLGRVFVFVRREFMLCMTGEHKEEPKKANVNEYTDMAPEESAIQVITQLIKLAVIATSTIEAVQDTTPLEKLASNVEQLVGSADKATSSDGTGRHEGVRSRAGTSSTYHPARDVSLQTRDIDRNCHKNNQLGDRSQHGSPLNQSALGNSRASTANSAVTQ
ncbi:hypothetical protein EK21DRAFT_95019 [Setomelanomma holmii]|uniref:Uncharacterized protein n=1 Tax=Setomelanomma holmii TaxID=210430 RepID=A0A9P4GX41_9PLEO|nr:hypothetical protein EK21DRAFT_95019 [Setomelanomma holmii]